MLAAVLFGVRTARNRLQIWAGRTALAVGVLIAAFAAFLSHGVTVAAPLFAQAPDVPSVSESKPSPRWAPAVEPRQADGARGHRGPEPARSLDRGRLGRGHRLGRRIRMEDVVTQTPVTPNTRFNIGTAAAVVAAAEIAALGMTNTGTDSAAEWSPEAIGEPGEDFPPLALIRHVILQPIGLASSIPLRGDRATFYVPRSDDNHPGRGRRLMYMRDLACCAGGMAFYSTPSDLVRFALATKADSLNGALAGGSVMSLVARRDNGIVVAVASNVAHANAAALALKVADVFAEQK